MAELKVVKIIDEPNQAAVELAQKLLERSLSAEFVEISAICIRADGSYMTIATKTGDAASHAGMHLAAAMDCIKHSEVN